MNRALAQGLVFTKFLIEKDCLAAAFTRMGSGFSPPTVLSEARHHLMVINDLMDQMETLSKIPKNAVVHESVHQKIQKSCCGRD